MNRVSPNRRKGGGSSVLHPDVPGDGGQRRQVLIDRAQTRAHRVDRHVGGARQRSTGQVRRRPARTSPRQVMRPSIPIADGSLPAAIADRATMSRASSSFGPGDIIGNHPSANRPARSNAGRDAAPIHTGIGRVTGSGARPAPVTRWCLPSNVTVCSVHSRRISSTCSPNRLPRLVKFSPSASYSTAFQPSPTPSRSRPSLSRSTSAACLATSTACRCGRMMTPVTSSSVVVTAAR